MRKYFYLLLMLLFPFVGMAKTITVSIGDLRYNLDTDTHEAEVTYKAGFNTGSTINNYDMTTLVLPSSVEYEGEQYSVASVGEYAFKGCRFTDIQLPVSLKVIGNFSFTQCTVLPSVVFPEGLTDIGEYAFNQCTELRSVTFPTTLKNIGNCGFYNCNKLTTIIAPGQDYIKLATTNVFGTTTKNTASVYVSADLLSTYKSQFSWTYFKKFYAIDPVTSISIEGRSHTIEIDETITLTAVVSPSNATVTNIRWESSNPLVASVDASGVVTGVAAGKAVISAVAIDGSGVSGTFDITVLGGNPVTGIKIEGGVKVLKTTETLQLTAIIIPEDASYNEISWSSSDPSVATVSDEGLVTAIEEGDVVITAFLAEQPEIKDTYHLEIQKRLLGDSNDNGVVTVSDVVTTAYHIVGLPTSGWCFLNADVTQDKVISIADVTATTDIILNEITKFDQKRRISADMISMEGYLEVADFSVAMSNAGESELNLHINSGEEFLYSGLQFDIVCPEGVELTEVRAGDDLKEYTIQRKRVGTDQLYTKERIVVYGNGLQATGATESLLYLTFTVSEDANLGENTGRVERVYLSDPLGRDIILEDSEFTVTVVPTPAETPTALLRKGDGTSHTFVVMMEKSDDVLDAEGYHYVFGYGNSAEGAVVLEDTPWRYTHTTEEIYWNAANDFWVFAYYMDHEGTLHVGERRHLDGSVDNDFNPADFIGAVTRGGESTIGIYTLDGRYAGKTIDSLQDGIYIVKTSKSSNKIVK